MRVLTPHLIADKRVLLRLDLDVPLSKGTDGRLQMIEDFRLRSSLPTLYLCLDYAKQVIVMGHIGRPPAGGEDPSLSVAPIVDWLDQEIPTYDFPENRLQVLENLRFEAGEEANDENYAKELASLGDFYVNEAFASHHPSASTTLVPKLLPHCIGFHFDHEIRVLTQVRNEPKKPLVAVIGGAKIEDKLEVVKSLSRIADKILLGGKLPTEVREKGTLLPEYVMVAKMNGDGQDLSDEDIEQFSKVIKGAKEVIWSGPMGKYEDGFQKGNQAVAEAIISSGVFSVVGGGDTISALSSLGLINNFSFVSTGGGAMLKFLAEGTLPTIEAMD